MAGIPWTPTIASSSKYVADLENKKIDNDSFFESIDNNIVEPKCLSSVDLIFVLLTLTIGIMSLAAIFLNAFLVKILYRSRIMHPNVLLLLKNLAIAVFLCSLFMFLRFACYHPLLVIVGFRRLVIPNTTCALFELPFYVCAFALILSITGIGLERLSATVREKRDSEKAGIGTKLTMVATWLIGATNALAYYVYARNHPTTMCYCQLSLITSQKMFAINSLIYVLIEISVLFAYWYVYWRSDRDYGNFTINTARHSLHARFQLINNLDMTRTLMPVVMVHALTYSAYLLGLTAVRQWLRENNDEPSMALFNAIVAVHHFIPLEMLIQPILIVRRSEHLKKLAIEMFPRLTPLWGSRIMLGHQQYHGKPRRSAAGAALLANAAPSTMPCGGVAQITVGADAALSVKRRAQQAAAMVDNTVVDYRMRPETHQDILEHIWAAKPLLTGSDSVNSAPNQPSQQSSGAQKSGAKKFSFKRNSLTGALGGSGSGSIKSKKAMRYERELQSEA